MVSCNKVLNKVLHRQRQIRILTWKLISGFIVEIWQIQHSTNSTPSCQGYTYSTWARWKHKHLTDAHTPRTAGPSHSEKSPECHWSNKPQVNIHTDRETGQTACIKGGLEEIKDLVTVKQREKLKIIEDQLKTELSAWFGKLIVTSWEWSVFSFLHVIMM